MHRLPTPIKRKPRQRAGASWKVCGGASTRKLSADRAGTDPGPLAKVPAFPPEQANQLKSFSGSASLGPMAASIPPRGHKHGLWRLPLKFNACYTFAARRGAFNGLVPSHSPGFACAEFRRCGPATGIAGGGLSNGRRSAGGAGFPSTGVVRFSGGASGRGQRGVGKRPGCEHRAGRGSGSGAVRVPAAAAGNLPEMGGGDTDICDGIGCWAHGAAPVAGRARGRFDRASTGFEL